MAEWLKAHAWKACIPQGIQGSNPCLSATSLPRAFAIPFAYRSSHRAKPSIGICASLRYLEILSMTNACEALRTYSLPVTVTCSPANGISFGFCEEDGVLLSMGRKMVPSSRRMTSVEPFFAQAFAHATPMGLSRPLVYAHAESMTHPEIVMGVPPSAATAT